MGPRPLPRDRHLLTIGVVLTVAVVLAGTLVWVEASVIWAKPGPPVELLGINRTLAYSGGFSGFVSGSVTTGCPACPLLIPAGRTVVVNASWLTTDPFGSHVNYTFVNLTILSSYPFLGATSVGTNPPTEYSFSTMWEAGGPGGAWGQQLTLSIPVDSSRLPITGYIDEWINASASTAPYPSSA